MTNPKKDCGIHASDHFDDMRILRGLTEGDVERLVREGQWRRAEDGKVHSVYGKWRVILIVEPCHLFLVTGFLP